VAFQPPRLPLERELGVPAPPPTELFLVAPTSILGDLKGSGSVRE